MQPWQGKSIWIWQVPQCEGGNVQAIIQTAKTAGIQALIVKAHDGTSMWSQFSKSLIDALHSAGLSVGAWGYCYGKDPSGEASCASETYNLGADFYVADVEVEFDSGSMWNTAETLISSIKAKANGKPVGYTSFALPQFHPGFPFAVFSKYADFTMPQVYWDDMQLTPITALNECIAYYEKYGVPIIPIGQSYGPVTPTQISQFINVCSGLTGYSFWDYQHATTQIWEAVSNGKIQGVKNMLQVGSTGDAVKQLQTDLNEILKINLTVDGVYGPATEAAVRTFQQIKHLQVDGIAGPQTLVAIQTALNQEKPKPAPAPNTPTNAELVAKITSLLQQAGNLLKGVK